MVKGIARKLDDLGRITIPKEYRDTIGLENGAYVGMIVSKNIIHLVKADKQFKGMARHLDYLGRYCIPIESRRALKLGEKELVDMYIENGEICIKKASLQCVMCGSEEEDDLIEVDGVYVCRKCAAKTADKLYEKKVAI